MSFFLPLCRSCTALSQVCDNLPLRCPFQQRQDNIFHVQDWYFRHFSNRKITFCTTQKTSFWQMEHFFPFTTVLLWGFILEFIQNPSQIYHIGGIFYPQIPLTPTRNVTDISNIYEDFFYIYLSLLFCNFIFHIYMVCSSVGTYRRKVSNINIVVIIINFIFWYYLHQIFILPLSNFCQVERRPPNSKISRLRKRMLFSLFFPFPVNSC